MQLFCVSTLFIIYCSTVLGTRQENGGVFEETKAVAQAAKISQSNKSPVNSGSGGHTDMDAELYSPPKYEHEHASGALQPVDKKSEKETSSVNLTAPKTPESQMGSKTGSSKPFHIVPTNAQPTPEPDIQSAIKTQDDERIQQEIAHKYKADRVAAIYRVITNYRTNYINVIKAIIPHKKELSIGQHEEKYAKTGVLDIILKNTKLPVGGWAYLRGSKKRTPHSHKQVMYFRMKDSDNMNTFERQAEDILKNKVKCEESNEEFDIKRLDLQSCGAAVEKDIQNSGQVVVGVILVPEKTLKFFHRG